MNSEGWQPTRLIFKSNLRLCKFNSFLSNCFVQMDATQIPKFNFHFDLGRKKVSMLSLFVNDLWHDSRIIDLVSVYLGVCMGWGLGRLLVMCLRIIWKFLHIVNISVSISQIEEIGIGNNEGREHASFDKVIGKSSRISLSPHPLIIKCSIKSM